MKVPQIVQETGVSGDYFNEYAGNIMLLKPFGLKRVAEGFRKYPVKKYEQRFPYEVYEDVITQKNQERVKRLNELSDLVNERFIDISSFTEEDFKEVINEVKILVYGSRN